MKLFSSVFPQIQHVLVHGRWFTPSVVVLFLGLEMFGRQATSDVHDTVGALVLMVILAGITIRHRVNPIGWVKRLGAMTWVVARLADRLKIEFGPDLRGHPTLPVRVPLLHHLILLTLVAIAAIGALVWWNFPLGWRSAIVFFSYTAYLAVMSVLWGMLFVAALGGVYIPVRLLNRFSGSERQNDLRISSRQFIFLGAYVVFVAAAAWYLPAWLPLAFLGLAWLCVCCVLLIPGRPGSVSVIWRKIGSSQVFSLTPRRLIFQFTSIVVAYLAAVIVSATGGGIVPSSVANLDHHHMPLTMMLGASVAWMAPGLVLSIASFFFIVWANDPARPRVPGFAIAGVGQEFRKMLALAVGSRGWAMRFDQAERNDVKLRLVPQERSEINEFEPGWPLAVGLDDFSGDLLYERSARREEIQLRRDLLSGVETLLKRAKNRNSAGGCGYWFAPHLWFVVGLTRDEITGHDEEPSFLTEIIGPSYDEVFGPKVRNYSHGLLKSLQIDLIFIEDGVGHRRMNRVLRRMFELFDKSNGRKRAEDLHFQGMSKVRVMFHDFDVNETFKSQKYPEPKFSPLGRLRVMHVFRDRGEDEELVEPPFNWDETPVPYLVG